MTTQAAKAAAPITRYTAAESTEEMRQRAANDRWQATLIEGQIAGLQRRAAQAEHEADLWIACYDAEELMDAELARGSGLDAAVEGAQAAEKQAREQRDKAVAADTRADGAWKRADSDDSADPDHVADLAARKTQTARTAEKARGRHEAAKLALAEAEAARDAHLRKVQELHTAYDQAGRKAEAPGDAPMTEAEKTFRVHISVADMSEIEREWVRMSYGQLIGVHDRPAPAQPDPVQRTRLAANRGLGAQVAGMDPGRARVISDGRGTVIIPATAGRG